MVSDTLTIEFDLNGLRARVVGSDVSESGWLQIKLLLCSVDSVDTKIMPGREIDMPWSDFRRLLQPLAKLAKEEEIHVTYDDQAEKLIRRHVEDTLSIQKKGANAYDESAIKPMLAGFGFNRRLKPEQMRDIGRLIGIRHGADFSVPGSGKTAALLAVHAFLRQTNLVTNLLVVSPRNAFISWENEVTACFAGRELTVCRLTGGKDRIQLLLSGNPDIALISYQQLPIVVDDIMAYLFRNRVHLVLDESHRVKRGYPGIFFSSAARLADFAARRDILSGTPMPQSVSDLVPQFDFLWPGVDLLTNLARKGGGENQIESANRSIKDLYVRTTKSELNLTPPHTRITRIELGPIQHEIYQVLRSEAARIAAGMDRDNIARFRVLGKQVMRLLQASSNPALMTSNDEYPDELAAPPIGSRGWELLSEFSKYERPAKIEYALNRVRELTKNGRKVVVWSAFVKNVQLLESKLSDLGAVTIYGAIETGDENDAETREWRLKRFHESDNCRVLIANPAAGGEGISLHKVCHDALYLDRTFNAAHFLQSVDRIHRLGLDPRERTEVEIIEAKNTIDGVVDARINDKIRAMAAVLDDRDLRALAYDPFDVVEENPAGIDEGDEHQIVEHLRE